MAKRIPYVDEATAEDKETLKTVLRTRKDFMSMRIGTMNRLGLKADGNPQEIAKREDQYNIIEKRKEDKEEKRKEDKEFLHAQADDFKTMETVCEKKLEHILRRFPIYNHFLRHHVKGIGTVVCAHIIAFINIEKADTVSKIWQYAGLNPGMVKGTKMGRFIDEDTKEEYTMPEKVDTMVRGDKPTSGFVLPYNKELKTALLGLGAPGMVMKTEPTYTKVYYDTKNRLENSSKTFTNRKTGEQIAWKDTTPGHRDNAAKRKMIKVFLQDLYVVWRTLENLSVRVPYEQEKLGLAPHPSKARDEALSEISASRAAAVAREEEENLKTMTASK